MADYKSNENFKGFVSIDGRNPESLGKKNYPFAIANNGKYIYYRETGRDVKTLF